MFKKAIEKTQLKADMAIDTVKDNAMLYLNTWDKDIKDVKKMVKTSLIIFNVVIVLVGIKVFRYV